MEKSDDVCEMKDVVFNDAVIVEGGFLIDEKTLTVFSNLIKVIKPHKNRKNVYYYKAESGETLCCVGDTTDWAKGSSRDRCFDNHQEKCLICDKVIFHDEKCFYAVKNRNGLVRLTSCASCTDSVCMQCGLNKINADYPEIRKIIVSHEKLLIKPKTGEEDL